MNEKTNDEKSAMQLTMKNEFQLQLMSYAALKEVDFPVESWVELNLKYDANGGL
jgi:hypothetical protein